MKAIDKYYPWEAWDDDEALPGRQIPDTVSDQQFTLWRLRRRAPHWSASTMYATRWYLREYHARRAYKKYADRGYAVDLCRTSEPVSIVRVESQ